MPFASDTDYSTNIHHYLPTYEQHIDVQYSHKQKQLGQYSASWLMVNMCSPI